MEETITAISVMTPFDVGEVNSFILRGEKTTLIDVGPNTKRVRHDTVRALEAVGLTVEEIDQLFITHHHPDHAGAVDLFPNATVIAHAYTDAWLRRDAQFMAWHDAFYERVLIEEGVPETYLFWIERMRRSARIMGERPVDRFVQEGDTLPHHPNWSVRELPGHAQHHLVLWNEETKQCIGGDVLLQTVASNPLLEPPLHVGAPRSEALCDTMASYERLRQWQVETMYVAHGRTILTDPQTLIDDRFAQIERRQRRVLDQFERGEVVTAFELMCRMYPEQYEQQLGLTLSQVLGLLDVLVAKGLVIRQKQEGVHTYARA